MLDSIVTFLRDFNIDYYSLNPNAQVFSVMSMLVVGSIYFSLFVYVIIVILKKRGNKKCIR